MFLLFFLLAAGSALYYETSAAAPVTPPTGVTSDMITSAVQKAIAHETSAKNLTDFAATLAPYNAGLASQLTAQAKALTTFATQTVAINAATQTAVSQAPTVASRFITSK